MTKLPVFAALAILLVGCRKAPVVREPVIYAGGWQTTEIKPCTKGIFRIGPLPGEKDAEGTVEKDVLLCGHDVLRAWMALNMASNGQDENWAQLARMYDDAKTFDVTYEEQHVISADLSWQCHMTESGIDCQ